VSNTNMPMQPHPPRQLYFPGGAIKNQDIYDYWAGPDVTFVRHFLGDLAGICSSRIGTGATQLNSTQSEKSDRSTSQIGDPKGTGET
jgi:hypothetical protein